MASYTEQVTLGDDIYTVADFLESVRDHFFTDYDGFGHPVKNGKCAPDVYLLPSKIEEMPPDATHVVWFNK
jgi:hypothetical protein